MSNRTYARALNPAVLVNDGTGRAAQIQCACGVCDEWRICGPLPPPDIVHKHFTRRGWRVDRKPACPQCQKRKPTMASVTPIKSPEPSPAARKVKQLVFMALMDYYDDAAKAYKPGHTDKSIAAECDCAEKFVKEVREADFGPLTPPSEVAMLRGELAAIVTTVDEIRVRLDALCKRNGWVG